LTEALARVLEAKVASYAERKVLIRELIRLNGKLGQYRY